MDERTQQAIENALGQLDTNNDKRLDAKELERFITIDCARVIGPQRVMDAQHFAAILASELSDPALNLYPIHITPEEVLSVMGGSGYSVAPIYAAQICPPAQKSPAIG